MNEMSDDPENLAQWTWQSLSELGERPALRVLSSGGEDCFSYDDLLERSRKVAKFLHKKTKPQSRILLCEKPGIAFLSGLLGCFLAGRLVAPTFEAANSRTLKRFLSIYNNFEPDLVLSSTQISGIDAANLSVQDILDKNPPPLSYEEFANGDGDIAALVQYTSGSTSDPKGVVLSGAQILHNLRAINRHLHFTRTDPPTVVSWLPPYHDLGLFSHLLSTLSVGGHLVILQPIDFIRSPYRWLKAISDYRADYSSAPDFAYRNCVKRIKAEQIADLDLSCWKAAVNAAEPINLSTLDQFYELCRPAGFKRESLMPAYGLAEATVFVSASLLNHGPLRAFFEQSAYRQSRAICVDNEQDCKDAIELVSSGKPIPEMQVRIVDPQTHDALAAGYIGEVTLKGPSVSSGYLEREDETQKSFINGYLHTGDLGFLYDGHLFITGRMKDLIILNGENFHPNDIEHLARQTLNVERAAAFALSNERDVVLCIEKNHGLDMDRLGSAAHRIYRLVLLEMGIELHKILFVRHNSLPVTSSGKIQRRQTRILFEQSALDVVHTYDSYVDFSRLGPQDLLNLIATICDKDPLELTVESRLTDLNFDSLNLLQLDIQLEKNFNLTLDLDQVPETILDLYAQIENIIQDDSKGEQVVPPVEITTQDQEHSRKNWQIIAKNYDDFIRFSGLLEDNPYQVIHICQRLYFFLPQKASKLLRMALKIYRENLYTNWFWYLPNFQKMLRDWKTNFPADYKYLSNQIREVKPGSVLVLAHMHGWEWIVENILYIAQEMGQDVVLIANTSVVEKLLNKKRRYMSGDTRAYYSNAILDVDSPRFDVDLLKALNEGRLLIALPDTVLAGGQLTHKQVVPFMMSDMALAAGVFKLAAQKERRVYQLEYCFTTDGPEMELVELSQPHHGTAPVEEPEVMVTRFGDSIARRMNHWAQWSILNLTGKPPRVTGDLKDENFFDRYGVVVLETGNVCVLHSLPLNRNIEISKEEYDLIKSSAQVDILKHCRADVLSLFPDLVLQKMPNRNIKIAVVSMSCRFPGGANSPEKFWDLLKNKGNAISDIPPGRFNASRFVDANMEKTGNSYVGKGGFLDWNPESFDPAPFNISPREAANMDPQQRLLLILTLELFVRAGYGVQAFKDQPVGVFIGGFCVDNLLLKLGPNNWDEINAHTATGSTLTMLANRISHTFDFTGPSFSLDTACSSSLVALHQGVRSLQSGECDCAIVGGANVIMSPEYYIAMSKGHFLSPNGRCATFDADADGYVRGEGAGLVLLKPYEQAQADGDPVLAVIEASGINQDGHTPGITLPSMVAQTRLLQDLLDKNDLNPHEIGYVEAHGTGTQAGDTAETTTLKNIFGDCLEGEDCLYVGSVKTNIGHLEAAAGIAGLIKSLLILQHGYLPANLHLNRFNPALAWDDRFKVAQDYIRHDMLDKKPAILVNSFGYGGTNAMVILKRPLPPSSPVLPCVENEDHKPLALSAYSYDGLHEHVRKVQRDVQATTDVYSYLYSLNNSNADGPYRRLVWYKNKSSLIQQLDDILTEKPALPGVQNKALALIYSGMGPHWWGMGRNLYENVQLFRETLDHVDELFQKLSGFSFIQAMGTTAQDSQIGRTEIDQPCGFGLQVALTTLLRHYGLKADCVMGHSLGEVCAFWASGWLTLEDAVCVVYHRSRLQARLRGQGGMLATALNAQEAQTYITAYDGVCLSAQNSTNMVTLGGNLDQLGLIAQDLEKSGIFNRFLRVEVAYHSHYMDAVEDELRRGLADISFQEPEIALYSTVSGQLFEGEVTPADYWWGNIRQAVAFQAGFCAMIEASTPQILEIGPHPVLSGAIQENLYHLQKNVPVLYSLHRDKDELERLQDILKHFYNSGFNLNWSAWYPVRSVCPVPIAPVVEKQLWVESALSKQCRFGLPGSPYLLNRVNVPGIIWAGDISRGFFPWLFDHKVKGEATFPGAGYLDAMFSAAAQMHPADTAVELHQVELRAMWLLNQDDNFTLFTKVDAATQQMELFTSVRNQLYAHQLNAVARYAVAKTDVAPIPDLQNEKELDVDDFYQQVQNIGFQYGPAFQVIKQLYLGDQTLRLRLEAPAQDVTGACYPPLLDGVFQSVLSMIITDSTYRKSYVPFSMERLCLLQPLASQLEAVVEITQMDAQEIRLNIWVSTTQGTLIFYGAGIRFIALAQEPKKLMDSYSCQWDVSPSEQNAEITKYALHPASSPVEGLSSYLDADADNKLLFLHDLNQPVAQIETVLFDHIKTTLHDHNDGNLLIVVAQDDDATGYLANMLHGLIQVLEKEGHKDSVRLVYGRMNDLLETVANWINSTQTVLHIHEKQGLAPHMTRLPDPVLTPVAPRFDRQLYFGWPLKNRLVEQGQSQQDGRLAIDILSYDKLFGAYGFIASKGTKRYIGACTQVDKRFVDLNEEYLVEVDETLCADTVFSALTYSVFDAVFQGKATFPRVTLHGLANKLQARAAHEYLDAYGVAVDETGGFQTCHLDFGIVSDRLEKNGIWCRINLPELIKEAPKVWQKSVQNTLHLLETKMLPKLNFKAQEPTIDGEGDGYCILREAGLQVTPRLSDVMQCVLITGGTGGFGLKMAHWLVEKGIKRVLLTSRSGQLKESQITALPSEIEVFALDVCDEQAVGKFFKRQNNRLAIDAVFHAAMVLNDQKIETLDKKAWDSVLAPKIEGAQVLDRLCRMQNIRHFVLFSSIASAIGNQHQAAYVVANRYLESLATERAGQGMPALAVQWGAIADAGIVKRSTQLQKILASQGIEAIQSRDAFERLEYELLHQSHPVIGIYRLSEQSQTGTGTALNNLVAEFRAMSVEDRKAKLLEVSRTILTQVLKQDKDDFPLDRPLNNLGLDSLMVIEVLMEFEAHIGLNLPSTLFMKQYSTHQLVDQINRLIEDLQLLGYQERFDNFVLGAEK